MLTDTLEGYMSPGALREMAGQLEPPFDSVKIANAAGAKVYTVDFDPEDGEEISGSVIIKDGEPVIYVARNHLRVRQRFTIAHEVGHLALGHLDNFEGELIDDAKRLRSATWNKEEREANAYAAELLMSKYWVKRAISAGIRTIDELSVLFDVSGQAMSIRLRNLRGL